ncbi:MAG: glycosyltransferase [Nostocaceae cyanobacterium]|nr:glycosyltransferase [Nostocaceae cyanobacterium]
MFYCQYLSGMGHLVRSTEIVRSLVKNFQVYFINGGPVIDGFEIPPQVELIRLPALWLENGKFTVGNSPFSVAETKESRKNQLIAAVDRVQPDCLITEFFPFGRHKLFFELLPLVEHIKNTQPNTKIVCSLRDVIGKVSDSQEEETIFRLMNQYFDLLLFHSDAQFQTFADSFSRHKEIKSQVIHTGFVTQPLSQQSSTVSELWGRINPETKKILVSVGGGRIGYELLEAVVKASEILAASINHKIQMFTGPFLPEEKLLKLQQSVGSRDNIEIARFTPQLLAYMNSADISISLSGYNTTMNILSTGVRAIVVPIGHDNQDKEQLVRTQKLEELGIVEVVHPEILEPAYLAERIIASLNNKQETNKSPLFNLNGAENTAAFLQDFLKTKVLVSANVV